jgi:hypothetical protein
LRQNSSLAQVERENDELRQSVKIADNELRREQENAVFVLTQPKVVFPYTTKLPFVLPQLV